jgi:hypothetical protein
MLFSQEKSHTITIIWEEVYLYNNQLSECSFWLTKESIHFCIAVVEYCVYYCIFILCLLEEGKYVE